MRHGERHCLPTFGLSVLSSSQIPFVLFIVYRNGDELQKMSVMEQLASLLETEDRNQVIDNLLPSVNKLLGDASIEIHFSASITFLQILQENIVPLNIFEQIFLRLIIHNLETENQSKIDSIALFLFYCTYF